MDNLSAAGAPQSEAVFPPRLATNDQTTIAPVTAMVRPWGVIYAIVAALIVLVGVFMLYSLTVSANSRIRRADTAIQEIKSELQTEPLATIDQKASQIVTLVEGYDLAVKNRPDFTKITDEVTKLLPSSVKINTLSVDANGQFRTTLRAGNFIDAGKALLGLRRSTYLQNVALETINFDAKERSTIDFALVGLISMNQIQMGTTEAAATQGVPESLFGNGS